MDYQKYFEKGITYEQFFTNMLEELESGVETQFSQYLPLNAQRSRRVGKTIRLHEQIAHLTKNLDEPLNWLVVTEAWCGDSSQILPIINAVAEASEGKINLRIVYRDQNPELIQQHLTNGAMAIPIILQLDNSFKFLKQWGPRPLEAQNLVTALKSNPATSSIYSEELHKWYAMDKTNAVQKDLFELLNYKEVEV